MAPPSADYPGLHPEPPPDLHQRDLPLVNLAGPWFRLYSSTRSPLHFGRSGRNRFDAPDSRFGVCYAGETLQAAFVETFGRLDNIHRLVTRDQLGKRFLARVTARTPLAIVDLTGAGLAALGADSRLTSADYGPAQRWSAALRAHPARPAGLRYRARHDPSRTCVALFEHVAPDLLVTPLGTLLETQLEPLLSDLLADYGLGLI